MSVLDFKRRLRLLVRAYGSQATFAREMGKYDRRKGRAIDSGRITKWTGERYDDLPGVEDLLIIAQIERDVSLDYLFGRAKPATITEKFIEERLK